ncbi:PqiC family protein [Methylobacillus flagellatus]|uniref:PqiC family protein n=1 Tax=Methylobacillus flagellatus TaxID=405 RepID=UPI0010F48793|nr:PqiC family protein [Methylobacillus flagellatus]
MPTLRCSITLALAVLLAACATPTPTRFYTLTTAATTRAEPASQAQRHEPPLFIVLAPVGMPERLARPQIVVRTGAARIDILEKDRWSAPFNSELRDALASAVSSRLSAVDVTRSGKPAHQAAYRIAVELHDWDAVKGEQLQADLSWTVTRSDDKRSAICRTTALEPARTANVDSLVQASQRLVQRLGAAIASNVTALEAGNTASCEL